MKSLDPGSAALYALIAISLVLIGALLTPGSVGLNERGAVLGGIVVVLFTIARLFRPRHHGPTEVEPDDDEDVT